MAVAKLKRVVQETFKEALEDNLPRLGAALAFYTALSLAPMLLLIMAIAGHFVPDRSAVSREVVSQVRRLAGEDGADVVKALVESEKSAAEGVLATVLSLVILSVGATGVFAELQGSLDSIWDTQTPRVGGLWGFVRARLLALAVIGGMVLLLFVSLLLSAGLAASTEFLNAHAPGLGTLLKLGDTLISFLLAMLLFALIFRLLPNAEITWADVWTGAAITAVLFAIGKYAIGLYLGHAAVGSTYGKAGSFVVFLVWIYYSAQILLLGAEFTEVYSRLCGSRISQCPPESASAPSR